MAVCRLVGWVFLSAALVLVGAEMVRSLEVAQWSSLALGELWFALDPGGVNLAQAVVQRYLHPALWDPAAVAVLRAPAWLVPLVLALALLWLCRRRRVRRRR